MDQSIITWEGMSGVTWLGSLGSGRVIVRLRSVGNILHGSVQYRQRTFELQAISDGLRAEGQLLGEPGEAFPISLLLQGSEVQAFLYDPYRTSVIRSVVLRAQDAAPEADRAAGPDTWLDSELFGYWERVETQSDTTALTAISQPRIRFYSRGELRFTGFQGGAERLFSLINKRSDTEWYHWQSRTEVDERILFIQDNGQWLRYGRYFIEEGRMLITHSDGEREYWKKLNSQSFKSS